VLHQRWKAAQVNFQRVFIGALILIVLGGIGTFPPFYEAVGRAEAAILDGR